MGARFWLALLLGASLVIGPTGSIATLQMLERFATRLAVPVTPEEQQELDFLNCVYQASMVIPERSDVEVETIDDSYVRQRTRELLHPRLRPVSENGDYGFFFGVEPNFGLPISEEQCGGLMIVVTKRA